MDLNSQNLKKSHITNKLDDLVLNRFLGIPIFIGLIYCVFTITIQGGGYIQGHMSNFLRALLIEKVALLLQSFHSPEWLIALLSAGVGQGLHTTLCFIPVIASMFFCLSFLETSGYMARAAIVMDKTMRRVGLSGKSFMPMILGFGCNVPAILSTRTLENPKERILTILMTPFMSCGARLAVYALFVAAFFPSNGTNIIFALYMVGIMMALLTGWILGKALSSRSPSSTSSRSPGATINPNVTSNLSKEAELNLPPYRFPNIQKLMMTTYSRVKSFILNAGLIIIPLCMLIGTLGMLKTDGEESYMTRFGRHITPIFAPMGIEKDNWQATVGLLSGLVAKEVMVGTLTALYAEPTIAAEPKEVQKSNIEKTNNHGFMVERFGSQASAIAYLLFVLLYFPCVSVLASISRELNFSWALFSSIWTTGLAYGVAVLFYQIASFSAHPNNSLTAIGSVLAILGLGLMVMRSWANAVFKKQDKLRFPTRMVVLES